MTDAGPWAKLTRADDGTLTAILPLLDHCLDVGAALEGVLPVWLHSLEVAAGRPLTPQDMARLIVLAALHDLGKANHGFQARIDPAVKQIVGHTGPVAALLRHAGFRQSIAGKALLEVITSWGAADLFAAVMAHHGRPLAEFHRSAGREKEDVWKRHIGHWEAIRGHDPKFDVVHLIEALRARWPLAWQVGPPLPDAPRFAALFAGLVTLADWLGSDTRRFPVDGPHGMARDALRRTQAGAAAAARGFTPLATPPATFETIFGNPPYAFQADAAAPDLGPVALIEAETGSGKTEAALWRWLEMRRRGEVDGLFFALPTRSAAVQLHARVNDAVKTLWGADAPPAVLAVPGYLRAGDAHGQALPGYAVRWDRGEPGGAEDARWAAERANRFLAARVAVGTIDQALLSVLPVKHAFFRASVLARSLLVVDEVHASDAYMTGLLERLLDQHVAVGGRALLLSATLGAAARGRLLRTPPASLAEAEALPYPALSGTGRAPRAALSGGARQKQVAIETAGLIADPDAVATRAVAAARDGAAVLVVRNSVAGAIAVAQAVATRAPDLAFRVEDVPTLHHGRFAATDRQRLDKAVETAFGKARHAGGCVLVGTQTLEQSLDIDADFLITDLAPMDVLLQRIGRLHRHGRKDRGAFAQARVLVLRPEDRDLTPLLEPGRGGRHGLGDVYPNVLHLEATLRLIEARPDIAIPRDNRLLVERALHPDALKPIAQAGGAAWINHASRLEGGVLADGQRADGVALDLSKPFFELVFPDDMAEVMTRLGARDLLLDLDSPLASPFGGVVARVTLPGWMAARAAPGMSAERLDDRRFRFGERVYVYDQWGLRPED
ncbi:CRISPR-associated helicase Cas3' [Sphingomonas fuzhouensis]|uniref:CRISPR-associated helicase Cas3' n=1 Tax=Sphingomonas fuzhouensis TaxID=3106033 RepID=UPI002AFE6CB8|nr:CRISPR-associated helicase Cas3' [Sphingomonas sp. SGZ-02]